jgi:WhiB family transcriptional regulator, redox-sensing transcriptional regulator
VTDIVSDDEFFTWQLHGNCLAYPSDWFFPEEETSKRIRRERERAAKQVCLDCPVLAKCRDYAMNMPEKHGIWGATTARERALVRASATAFSTGWAS